MPGRHFHFALEIADASTVDAVAGELVGVILRQAGLSAADASEAAARTLAAARKAGSGAPCRMQFDADTDAVRIVVTHDGRPAWRDTRPVE